MSSPTLSVVIATYNRAPILEKCLRALLAQTLSPEQVEIVVIDDGSQDDTRDRMAALQAQAPQLRYHWQPNAGRSHARNVGIAMARGELVVFIDSDVVVVPDFLAVHRQLHERYAPRRIFVQGLSVNTDDFHEPLATPVRWHDVSAAFFATNNVSIPRRLLEEVGGFDEGFVAYGYEDLELGVRLKRAGVGIVRSRKARGFHWHPRFTLADLPGMRAIEVQRGRMGAYFFRQHPTWAVRMIVQHTPLHRLLDWLVRGGGRLDETRAEPWLRWLLARGHAFWAQQLAIVLLNRHYLATLAAELALPPAERPQGG
ncbi:MAG: glycosyltransferase [Candidatus Sericytochromatia bacterium]|nr:glycosyltransferase [Candidatus Sericytochromatia bacterium]